VVEPGRDLGHVDRSLKKGQTGGLVGKSGEPGEGKAVDAATSEAGMEAGSDECKDC
jgi:hypothetical protein